MHRVRLLPGAVRAAAGEDPRAMVFPVELFVLRPAALREQADEWASVLKARQAVRLVAERPASVPEAERTAAARWK